MKSTISFSVTSCVNLCVMLLLLAWMSTTTTINGFVPSSIPMSLTKQLGPYQALYAAKGFGNKDTSTTQPKKSKKGNKEITSSSNDSTTSTPPIPSPSIGSAATTTTTTITDTEPTTNNMSRGKVALDELRRERAEARNEEIQKLRQVQDLDNLLKEQPEAAVIPEKVAQRMGKRMLPFVGIPLFGAMGTFVGFWYMATYRDMEFQPALVATATVVLLAIGLVGITYSIMSASWDPDREGTLLGTEEFQQNIDNIKTGLSRSKENARLREKFESGYITQEELNQQQQAILNEKKKKQSFSDKIGDELE